MKVQHTTNWATDNNAKKDTYEWNVNAVARKNWWDLFDVSHGVNATWVASTGKLKALDYHERCELKDGYVNLLLQFKHDKVDNKHKVNLDKWNVSWYNKHHGTEVGALLEVAQGNANLTFGLARNVKEWNETLFGRTWDLSHDLKANVNNAGTVNVLVTKKVNNNLNFLLSGRFKGHEGQYGCGLHFE